MAPDAIARGSLFGAFSGTAMSGSLASSDLLVFRHRARRG
jgi:hypothetical protein